MNVTLNDLAHPTLITPTFHAQNIPTPAGADANKSHPTVSHLIVLHFLTPARADTYQWLGGSKMGDVGTTSVRHSIFDGLKGMGTRPSDLHR